MLADRICLAPGADLWARDVEEGAKHLLHHLCDTTYINTAPYKLTAGAHPDKVCGYIRPGIYGPNDETHGKLR